ncbi:beta-N-acetylhexosaminidase [Alistipes sp. ZOR0009]|uniref:beta-N-acetylhexosaminidase n=1 Tax=Alistipes sp. ZOR0009 TaxID=1339253 RepID=UPI00068B6AF3|nr:family 20 glycosylhydrolase [Alistipes sp. ZOR0009]
MKKMLLAMALIGTVLQGSAQASSESNIDPKIQALGLIPLPTSVNVKEGKLALSHKVTIAASSKDEKNVSSFITSFLKGKGVAATNTSKKGTITLKINKTADSRFGNEGYALTVTGAGVTITANAGAGLFYGAQTFMQLFPVGQSATIPQLEIVDNPTFKWRGMMLDVARHMMPVEFIKQYIDMLAQYKINTFHWHLTDDQGWRIEIKKYPKLTQISSKRKGTLVGWYGDYPSMNDFKFDGKEYGGYYTQEQVKEIVAYAAKRYITVVPEIEMPGHSVCVLAAYPELACKPGNYEVATYWGVFDDIVCPTEQTINFFQDVLTEVIGLFPSTYIHIGGDEAPKTVWKQSQYVQDLMKKEGIDDVEKVQGWFNRRIEDFLKKHNRKLIGWDEILEGGISESATIMSWRGEKGGIEAANHGNDVVMSPSSQAMYFDHAQGKVEYEPKNIGRREGNATLYRVYSYNPIPAEIDAEKRKHIIGVQANIWTEYIKTPEATNYVTYPRIFALSETLWKPADSKSWNGFTGRMAKHFSKLDALKLTYRIPEPFGLEQMSKTGTEFTVSLSTPFEGATIRYTTDGSMPNASSAAYAAPVTVKAPNNQKVTFRAVTFLKDGRTSAPAEATFNEPAPEKK